MLKIKKASKYYKIISYRSTQLVVVVLLFLLSKFYFLSNKQEIPFDLIHVIVAHEI